MGGSLQAVLFDLDGTLCDSAPGILAALRHALTVNGLPLLDPSTERDILGPPFDQSLPPLIGADLVPVVIDAYRACYAGGAMYDATVFPGVRALLDALHGVGTRLAVATSKPEAYAVPVLEHLEIAGYFEAIGGDDLEGTRHTKALVIEHVLNRLGRPEQAEILMVGDRRHDIEGARAHGIETLAVTWGYAMPGELEAARPLAICSTASELVDRLTKRRG